MAARALATVRLWATASPAFPDSQIDTAVDAAEECPGECIMIEPIDQAAHFGPRSLSGSHRGGRGLTGAVFSRSLRSHRGCRQEESRALSAQATPSDPSSISELQRPAECGFESVPAVPIEFVCELTEARRG